MARVLDVAVAQINATVGDLDANAAAVLAAAEGSGDATALVTPEMVLAGYPAEDLVLDATFAHAVRDRAVRLAAELAQAGRGDLAVVVGALWPTDAPELDIDSDAAEAGMRLDAALRSVANVAVVLRGGAVEQVVAKHLLPTYAVFDEARTFAPGLLPQPGRTRPLELTAADGTTVRAGIAVCEDIWAPGVPDGWARVGVDVLLTLNASPWHRGKLAERTALVRGVAAACATPIVYANLVGGQDELVFDGTSFALDASGAPLATFPSFAPHTETVRVPLAPQRRRSVDPAAVPSPRSLLYCDTPPVLDELELTWRALVCGTGDYVRKNGFGQVVVGLSGGIDSAVVATIAVDALGADAVSGVGMPGPYSSGGSVSDAAELAERLGIRFSVLPIGGPYSAFGELLGVGAPDGDSRPFAGRPFDAAEENLQARLRGTTLMALANKGIPNPVTGTPEPTLVLTTSNQSESAVGYSTLYGDAAGGFAPIKSCPKTLVYALAEWRNRNRLRPEDPAAPIPAATITKPPSAELAPGQRDDQSLPPYELLDAILDAHVVDRAAPAMIVQRLSGHPAAARLDAATLNATVERVCSLVRAAEHKRRQSPPGVRVSRLTFGRDRRWPITNRWSPQAAAPSRRDAKAVA